MRPLLAILLALAALGARGEEIRFTADFYQRDMGKNTVTGRGNAWVRKGDKQIWADEFEVDFKTQQVIANGNVHVKDGTADIWCSHASYSLSGEEGTLDDAVLVRGQMVMTGAVIRKHNKHHFTAEEGTYSNCNTELVSTRAVTECRLDWRIYGRRFSITTEEYAHFHDAIVYVRDLPVLYTPYFLIPVKSRRQTGFLLPFFFSSANLGSGVSLPFFVNLGTWHDLTLTPTNFSRTGYHGAVDYRYVYDGLTRGSLRTNFTQRRFSPDVLDPSPDDTSRDRLLGFIGEWSILAHNTVPFGDRGMTRQTIQLVSDPYYTQDYAGDLGISPHASYLRSQVTATLPGDRWLGTAMVRYFQSLAISRDTGTDGGGVVQAPALTAARTTSSLLEPYLSYEWDLSATNFVRGTAFDQVPSSPAQSGTNTDADASFDDDDYLRTGRRVGTEARLIANVPMPQGLQLQPVLGAGALFYHFDYPRSGFIDRQYVQFEVPFSLYLSRTFETGIGGLEKLNHVFQPRAVYSSSPYQRVSHEGHPFFFQDEARRLANPRFDLTDQFFQYEYMRFELINRFRRKLADSWSRFFLLQVSQQFNLRTSPVDPRFVRRLGPLELYSDLGVGALVFQLQATYDLETTRSPSGDAVRENSWSGSLAYRVSDLDYVRANVLLRTKADRALTEQSLYFDFAKTLPTFFDLQGSAEYSLKRGELLAYQLGISIAAKPRSCWGILLTAGRNSYKQPFTFLSFRLNFGNPGGL